MGRMSLLQVSVDTVEVSTDKQHWLDPCLSETKDSMVSDSAQRVALIQLEMILFVFLCFCVHLSLYFVKL